MRVRTATLAVFSPLMVLMCTIAAMAGSTIYKSNILTAEHIQIDGTHVAVVPPSGSRQAVAFKGFEVLSRNIRYEIAESTMPYSRSAELLTAKALEAEGIHLYDSTSVTLNEKPATLVQGTVNVTGYGGVPETLGLLLFVMGNDQLTTKIYGYYPEADKSAVNLLRSSMLSAIFRPLRSDGSGGSYMVSPVGTSFEFVDEVDVTRYYTVHGAPRTAALTDALFTSSVFFHSVPRLERETFARQVFDEYLSGRTYELTGNRAVEVDGLSGCELVATFAGAVRRDHTASGGTVRRARPGIGYQMILFDDAGKTYILNGIALRDADDYLSQFRQMGTSFVLKK